MRYIVRKAAAAYATKTTNKQSQVRMQWPSFFSESTKPTYTALEWNEFGRICFLSCCFVLTYRHHWFLPLKRMNTDECGWKRAYKMYFHATPLLVVPLFCHVITSRCHLALGRLEIATLTPHFTKNTVHCLGQLTVIDTNCDPTQVSNSI